MLYRNLQLKINFYIDFQLFYFATILIINKVHIHVGKIN